MSHSAMTPSLGWTVVYVDDPDRSVAWWSEVFGLPVRLQVPGGSYAELDTGATTLAFASHELAAGHLPEGYARSDAPVPLGMEVALVTDDPGALVARAVAAGATLVAEVAPQPQGQDVGWVRDPQGVLIEVCTPVAAG